MLSLLFEVAGNAARATLRFDRIGLENLQLWRLVSGHFVHLGWTHFALNTAGLILVWMLVGNHFSRRQWVVVIVVTIAAIDLGLWNLDTNLDWYVGLSGVLHGMLIAGAFAGMCTGSVEATALGVLVIGKIIWEQTSGPLPGSAALANGSVVVNAHLYGAIAGAMIAALLIRVRSSPPI